VTKKVMLSDKILRFHLKDVDPSWVLYFLRSDRGRRQIEALATGNQESMRNIGQDRIRAIVLPVPPAQEQSAVLAELEKQLTRIQSGTAALQRVQANLKRYRASVLKAACEGRLVPTEAELARRESRDYEPASVLLARILKERRRLWEESELAKLKAKGKAPADDRWKVKYQDPRPPELDGLAPLPGGWCWASIEQLGEVSGGLTQNAKRQRLELKLPFLRVANVYANELRLEEVEEIGLDPSELERSRLCDRDMLIVEGNGSLDQIGRVAIWNGSVAPCVHQNHLIKVRFAIQGTETWALHWLLSPLGRAMIIRVASSTSGLHTLSLSKVSNFVVPLPPHAEQLRVFAELDAKLTTAAALTKAVDVNSTRAARLRQAILKAAFEGKLVPQREPEQKSFLFPINDRVSARRHNGRRAEAVVDDA
jgi:type I restriction enzyme S subunit